MEKVRTRFAPSPTGNPHIGNIRTAFFAYLFTRRQNGKFLLRIEDTDKSREVEGSAEGILESLKWLEIEIDEKPVLQSANFEIHKKYAHELVEKGLAYEQDGAIYFKVPNESQTFWVDIIGNKKIVFENKTEKDFVILRSNGTSLYHLAATIDDHLMGITHIIRGDDWVSSTPKHIMIYQALGWEIPQFAHVPQVLASDRSKLSKRHGAVGVFDFKKDGYLPEAIRNYIALLGWTPKSGKEILSLEEMIEEFDLKDVHIAPAVFDYQKLEWMNGEYIRKMSDEELTKRLQEFLVDHPAPDKIAPLVPLVKERIKKLSDFVPLTDFIFENPEYDLEVFKKIKIAEQKMVLQKILEVMKSLKQPWGSKDFEQAFKKLAKDEEIKVGDMFQLIRVAVSGQLVTPPLFESIKIVGEKETLKRIQGVAEKYPNLV